MYMYIIISIYIYVANGIYIYKYPMLFCDVPLYSMIELYFFWGWIRICQQSSFSTGVQVFDTQPHVAIFHEQPFILQDWHIFIQSLPMWRVGSTTLNLPEPRPERPTRPSERLVLSLQPDFNFLQLPCHALCLTWWPRALRFAPFFCNIRRPMLHVGTSFSRDPDQARNWQGAASSCIKLDPSCTLPSFPKQVGRNRVVTSVILSPSGLELAAGDFVQPRPALQHPFAKEGRGSIGSICMHMFIMFIVIRVFCVF